MNKKVDIQERVLANAANWVDLARKGEISWDTVSLLINAFELGIAELSEELDRNDQAQRASEQVADVNRYLKGLGHEIIYPPFSHDKASVSDLIDQIKKTINFSSRRIHQRVKSAIKA